MTSNPRQLTCYCLFPCPKFVLVFFQGFLRPGNTGNIFLQLTTQQCCVASWKRCCTYYHPPSNIVTQQNFVVASWSSMLHQVELASTFFNKCFQLATTNFVPWQCLRWVVIRATTLFNLERNNVACNYWSNLLLVSLHLK